MSLVELLISRWKKHRKCNTFKGPDIYVIFICEQFVLKPGKIDRHIQRYIDGESLFDDKVHIIYINANIQDETSLGKLMHDLMCQKPEDMYYEALRRREKRAEEKGKKLGVEQGEKRGEKQGRIKVIIEILLNKFPGMDFEWVKGCNDSQIKKIQKYIVMNINYDEFYKLVHS